MQLAEAMTTPVPFRIRLSERKSPDDEKILTVTNIGYDPLIRQYDTFYFEGGGWLLLHDVLNNFEMVHDDNE